MHHSWLIGQWIDAERIGDGPPACSGFSFNELPSNRGLLFGGKTDSGLSSDVYIVEIVKTSTGASVSHVSIVLVLS